MLEEEVLQRCVAKFLFIWGERTCLCAKRVAIGKQRRIQDNEPRMGQVALPTEHQERHLKGRMGNRADAFAIVAPPLSINTQIICAIIKRDATLPRKLPLRKHLTNGLCEIVHHVAWGAQRWPVGLRQRLCYCKLVFSISQRLTLL